MLPRRLASVCLVAFTACSGSPVDPIDKLDANVIVGNPSDASTDGGGPRDAGLRDVQALDVGDDVGPDAGPRDGPTPDALPPDLGCQEPSQQTLTASEALSQRAALMNTVITIVATATIGTPSCTDRACPMDDPCCNSCAAGIFVFSQLNLEATECASALCTGTECGLVCSPPTLGIEGSYRGRFSATATRGFELLGASF